MNDREERAWENIRAMRGVIEANRAEAERLRRLPDLVARAFVEANVYRFLVPEDLGGEGLDPLICFELAEELSSYDASVGWNFAVAVGTALLAGPLPLSRMREIFASSDCGFAGGFIPGGRAVAVDGGYRLTGKWGFLSGVYQAKWMAAPAIVFDGDQPRQGANGAPTAVSCIIPTSAIEILDTWHTGGMRGTGSCEAEISDYFVPDRDISQPFSGRSEHPAAVFRIPGTYFGMNFSAVPLGAARRALEALKDLGARKVSNTTRVATKDVASAQYAAAKAEALLETGKDYVLKAFRPVWENVIAGQPSDLTVRAGARRAYVNAAECAVEAVTLCYKAAGATALHQSQPFEQALRDVFAVSNHAALQRPMMELAGQVSYGMTPGLPAF
jgi:indole-3-acetate monooxygenase